MSSFILIILFYDIICQWQKPNTETPVLSWRFGDPWGRNRGALHSLHQSKGRNTGGDIKLNVLGLLPACYSSKCTHVVLLGAAPEVGAACVAGNVQHSDSLQAGQGDVLAVALAEGKTSKGCEPLLRHPRRAVEKLIKGAYWQG